MKATKYIVIGRYSHEQNSYIPNGDIRHVISGHRDRLAAARAAEKAHYDLGGCEGGDMLAQVMRRMEPAEPVRDTDDTYEHAGRMYMEVSVWDTHEVEVARGGLGLKVKR